MLKSGRIRIKANRFLTMRQSLVGLTMIQKCLAKVGLRRRKGWIELNGAAELLNCLVFLSQLAQADAQVVVGHDEAWPQLERTAEAFHRLGMLTKALECRAQVAQSFRIIRPDGQRRAAAAGGRLKSPRARYASARFAW